MLQRHTEIFFQVAQDCMCWIGLREPNPLSERWVDRAGYRSKGEDCKAKTSDAPDFRFAGLVVDPILCPEAFHRDSRPVAEEIWKTKFLIGGDMPPGFSRAQRGPEKGLVRQQGQAIYADYDLMALSKSNKEGQHLFTTNSEERALFNKVGKELNRLIGSVMIQHGSEFMWTGGIGARESEFVLWFGPSRKFIYSPSSMPKGGH